MNENDSISPEVYIGVNLILCGTDEHFFYKDIFFVECQDAVVYNKGLGNNRTIVLEEIKDTSITLKKSEDCYKLCLSAEFLQANSLDGYLYFGIMISNYNSVSQREMLLLSSSIDPRQWFDPVYFEKLVLE